MLSKSQPSDGNNQAQHPVVLFRNLSDSEKAAMLNEKGFLHGILIDGNDIPRKSIHTVARYKVQGKHHSSHWIEEKDNIISETISTKSSRITNYIHCGWSIEACSTITPWAVARIGQHHEADQSGEWRTKRTTFQRLSFNIPPADLIPHPDFESDIRQALAEETPPAKFTALDRVFENWGDVIATVFELGASLAISDQVSESAEDQSTYKTTGVNILGGDTLSAPEEIISWLSKMGHPSQWSMARIIRVIPVTDLLQNDLKQELHKLYSKLLSYRPLVMEGNSIGGRSFDGTPHAYKTIKGITIYSDRLVDALKVAYTDGIDTGRLGGLGGNEQTFCLEQDEFIVEIFVWTDQETIMGIQFATSKGRVSPHYGGEGGVPSVYNCDGVALSALSGRIKKNSSSKKDAVYRIQAIWRHNIVPLDLPHGHKYSTYVGGIGGSPFNDWPYMGPAESAYVSGIAIQGGKYIDSIQATYTITNGAQSQIIQKPQHGETNGDMYAFTLRPGEYFVKVQGRSSDYIIQLCFITNRGRSTSIYGRSGEGNEFQCEAPEGMRLAFIMGKSSDRLDGFLLAWAPV